ncbi:FecCD family ABC transporter permease [Paenibacillus enshidis]|uniref:FecCD family ABC transporter permease n=1 Tax=Paenibacillus enshidis TaxID=1458439 RepID=A0ABV5AZ61_9BACL
MSRMTYPDRKQNRVPVLLFLFSGGTVLLVISFMLSLKIGPAHMSWRSIFEAIFTTGSDLKEHLYIRTLRLPRAVLSGIVGAQLALAGLLTQLVTKNPLASPHVFGINAGASLAVVAGLLFIPSSSLLSSMGLAFAGAVMGALTIWSLTGKGPRQYITLALAGITVHFLFASLTEGAMLLNQYSTESMIFWLVGSVNHATWQHVSILVCILITGLIILLCLLPSLRMLELDDEVAVGLGMKLNAVRAAAMLLVVLFAGSAVAICGPIGFVCLIVPHIAKALIGSDLNVLAPFTALLGAILLLLADVLSRWIAFPFESPVGIVTAFIGAPAFIYLARRQGGKRA